MATGVKQQQRRATESVWNTSAYVLDAGELGVTTDTGVIKIGDGVNTWENLDPAFGSAYLPLLGKAADSELLDGISSDGFLKVTDADDDPTANKVAMRLSDGRLKAATATAADDLTTLAQQDSAISAGVVSARQESIVRTVTAATTIATTDVGKMIYVDHASTTAQVVVTIPANSTAAIPVGSWVDICAIGAGGVKFSLAGGVTLVGTTNVLPDYDVLRLLKTGTDSWLGMKQTHRGRLPQIRVYKNVGGVSYPADTDKAVPFNTTDANRTYNPDNEWFSLPPAGLTVGRRVIVNKPGTYYCIANWSGSAQDQSWIKIYKLTADNVLGEELGVGPTFWNGQAQWTGRLVANESIGAVFYSQVTQTDEADGLAGHRHDLTLYRIAD